MKKKKDMEGNWRGDAETSKRITRVIPRHDLGGFERNSCGFGVFELWTDVWKSVCYGGVFRVRLSSSEIPWKDD